MAKKETYYKQLDKNILALVGGEENVDNVIHCITRLRFYLKDESKADKDKLEGLSGVMGIVEANNQFQVIVGQAVDDIYKELTPLISSQSEEKEAETPSRFKDQKTMMGKMRYGFNQVIGVITGAVMPIIHILAASGIIKSVLAIGTTSGWITESGSAYLIINAMADTVFYFLPILIGYNAAKRLGGNPVLTAVIG